jgi:hypothetical protein
MPARPNRNGKTRVFDHEIQFLCCPLFDAEARRTWRLDAEKQAQQKQHKDERKELVGFSLGAEQAEIAEKNESQ